MNEFYIYSYIKHKLIFSLINLDITLAAEPVSLFIMLANSQGAAVLRRNLCRAFR